MSEKKSFRELVCSDRQPGEVKGTNQNGYYVQAIPGEIYYHSRHRNISTANGEFDLDRLFVINFNE